MRSMKMLGTNKQREHHMTNRYYILYKGRKLAMAYVSPHPVHPGHIVVSVIPLERKGKWEDSNLELKLENPLHDIFPDTKAEVEAVTEVIAQVAIEPGNVDVKPVESR